jgi:type IV pilus assembly protein PilA
MINYRRKNDKGFTLIELMVVIFIVGILSAVAIPMMKGRTEAAKWTEGKVGAGSIRTAIRGVIAEKGNTYDFASHVTTLEDLGFSAGDLDGKCFNQADYSFTIKNSADIAVLPTFTITVGPSTVADGPTNPRQIEMTESGEFTDKP